MIRVPNILRFCRRSWQNLLSSRLGQSPVGLSTGAPHKFPPANITPRRAPLEDQRTFDNTWTVLLAPILKLGPDLRQSTKLREAAQVHVEMLIRHREWMEDGANFFNAIELLREGLVVVAHHDHAFACISTRSPIIAILVPRERGR